MIYILNVKKNSLKNNGTRSRLNKTELFFGWKTIFSWNIPEGLFVMLSIHLAPIVRFFKEL